MRRFSLLLVEDDEHELSQLVKLLETALPGSTLDSAESIDEAHSQIDATISANASYDLAILDFRLPMKTGEMDDVDESVCRRLTQSMPNTIVGHITSYAKDTKILDHLERAHPAGRMQGFFLDKKGSGFTQELIKQVRASLKGVALERELNDLFSSVEVPRPEGEGARARGPRRFGSVSNRIMDLCLDISSDWKDLNLATKTQIQKFFLVTEEPGGVSVVLR